jgi:hypothetical protein
MEPTAKNSLPERSADDVLRVIRCARADGNIVYLNDRSFEERDTRLQFLGLLSRRKETPRLKAKAETYPEVTATEDEFLLFVKAWAQWISQFRGDDRLSEVA